MGYIQGIGQDFSPRDIRVSGMINYVVTRRKMGKSDEEIRALLSASGPLDRLHPCAGANQQNVCSSAEIEEAISRATDVQAERAQVAKEKAAAAASGSLFSKRNLMIAGGVIAVLWFMSRRK